MVNTKQDDFNFIVMLLCLDTEDLLDNNPYVYKVLLESEYLQSSSTAYLL